MRHLNPETLIDVADGVAVPDAVAHLTECATCRAQLDGLRQVMARAAAVDIPEPSPLFWDHVSARIHETVAAEKATGFPRWQLQWPWRMAAVVSASVAVVAVMLALRIVPGIGTSDVPVPPAASLATSDVNPAAPTSDDATLGLLSDLAGELDWDQVEQAGMRIPSGAADDAVADLTAPERIELQRLLREAMGNRGA